MAKLSNLGEYELHRWLCQFINKPEDNHIGIGDDCAVLDLGGDSYLLLTSDRVPTSLKGEYAGKFCVIHNFSDIVSKGGTPIGLLLNIYLPRDSDFKEDFQAIVKGAVNEVKKYGAKIIGGDVKEFSRLIIVGSGIGTVKKERFLPRYGANKGDLVAVTLTNRTKWGGRFAYIVSRYFNLNLSRDIMYQLEWIYNSSLNIPFQEMLAASSVKGITSCMDMSDGLGSALKLISDNRDVGFKIKQTSLENCLDPIAFPIAESLGIDPIKFCFSPGYDWENFLTIEPSAFFEVQDAVRNAGGDIINIGEVTESSVVLELKNGSTKELTLFFDEQFKQTSWEDEPKNWRDFQLFKEEDDER
jgi:thiamine-monophosphate kinase